MLKSNYFYKLWSRQAEVFHLIGFNQFFQKVILFLTYKIIEIPLYISAFPFVLFTRIVSPWIIFRFGFIRNDVIGHGVFDPEYYLSEYEFRKLATIDCFYFSNKKPPNSYWPVMLKRHLKIHWFFKYMDGINKLLPGGECHRVIQSIQSRDINGYLANTKQHIKFTVDENRVGIDFLKSIGLSTSEKFVCLIVRDSAYKEIYQPLLAKDWSYHDYRNCDINTYNKASLELAKKGYWVIRMGKGVREKFNATHSHIFDYATSEYRSDFLDLWLMANCHFAVSTGTGLDAVSDIFRRPVVYTNYDLMKVLVLWSNSISVPKKLFHELERRYLTITESLDHSYTHSNLYRKNFIKVVDLYEDEIRDAVMEMEARLSNSWVDSETDKELQKFFMDIYTSWREYPRYQCWINPEAFIGSSYLKNMPESFFK